ncbi:2-oxoglutarate dehydrogenase E1 component [Desertibacillus haloalkaliphilus]|uniref:2-oxoglutarate dehydrogenase E1 component n=1 Tax=Desertibacillus haloalkaliphilus TaxID=1328930 RepID=UPI001C26758D|nr:2-oxoglutarate dehydrogenase E1 component [Desertibacillus haloalkaliphilus]MBU8907602.1 2-oxoglutarate dehydrogenase E1 component [Desertibacillus haloalkaliphilus]
MDSNTTRDNNVWDAFHGPNIAYAIELYEKYKTDPDSLDDEVKDLFDTWGPPPAPSIQDREMQQPKTLEQNGQHPQQLQTIAAAFQLAEAIRSQGHLAAKIQPFNPNEQTVDILTPEHYQVTKEDLMSIPKGLIAPHAPDHVKNGWDAMQHLKNVYTKAMAFEFNHITNPEEKNWLQQMVESEEAFLSLTNDKRQSLLQRLTEVESFERFLHQTFVGQKRFSIEGLDTLVPMLDETIQASLDEDCDDVVIGMAHRGRLNVLAHIAGKPYEQIFSEFMHVPSTAFDSNGEIKSTYGWTGDVKYHLGGSRHVTDQEHKTRVTLAYNPSHLEFVNPIVEGYTRAAQEERGQQGLPEQNETKALAVLIHGDAAFPGQGVVSETLNLSGLQGYQTGGTLHIIANNNIGFTTESTDSRSTTYASDVAKGFEVPIIHVNADDPEACLSAVHLAYHYRKTFQKDVLIDLIGYRRFGHNEMDEPAATQPQLYSLITKHESVKSQYEKLLIDRKIITKEQASEMNDHVQKKLDRSYENVSKQEKQQNDSLESPEAINEGLPAIDTRVDLDVLRVINRELLEWPQEFQVYPKLKKILERREHALEADGKVDWSLAETLAFATILRDGTPIRLTGQDSERGTFAHRHLVLHDHKSGDTYTPLHHLAEAKASFAIHNSPLSEISVVGFEYGYNVFAPETLVLWEAQFGDFANAAQVIFDQFVSAARAKWGQKSGFVVLLPHGYEGQGPEHSSARLERFLQMSAENNWTVANVSTAAQYFHLLRRQAQLLEKEDVRPLVIMTPKSLLRNPHAASSGTEFSERLFQPVFEEQKQEEDVEKVERLLLSSGKVSQDIKAKLEKQNVDWLHVARLEQLYPLPKEELNNVITRFPHLKEIIWVQEEPKNMGAWSYIEPHLKDCAPTGVTVDYIGRKERSSTAEGNPNVHKQEQARILNDALTRTNERGSING